MGIRIIGFALAIVTVQSALAQADDWERLRSIPPNRSVFIRATDGKELKGMIRAWKPDGLTIGRGKQVSEIARVDVERVSMTASGSRARRAGWAALIGGAAGAILYIGLCSAGECDVSYALVGTAGAVTVGGISAGITAVIPGRKEVIYKRP